MLSFHIKFVQTDGWTDRQKDNSKRYAHDLSMQGHKNSSGNMDLQIFHK